MVGVVRLIVLKSVLLLSFGSSNPFLFHRLCGATHKCGDFSEVGSVALSGVALGFGHRMTTALFRCLQENFKEVTFSREGGGTTESQLRLHTTLGRYVSRCPRQTGRKTQPGAKQSLSLSLLSNSVSHR